MKNSKSGGGNPSLFLSNLKRVHALKLGVGGGLSLISLRKKNKTHGGGNLATPFRKNVKQGGGNPSLFLCLLKLMSCSFFLNSEGVWPYPHSFKTHNKIGGGHLPIRFGSLIRTEVAIPLSVYVFPVFPRFPRFFLFFQFSLFLTLVVFFQLFPFS